MLTDVNGTSGIQTTWSILGPIIALIGIAIAFAGCCGRSPFQTGFA